MTLTGEATLLLNIEIPAFLIKKQSYDIDHKIEQAAFADDIGFAYYLWMFLSQKRDSENHQNMSPTRLPRSCVTHLFSPPSLLVLYSPSHSFLSHLPALQSVLCLCLSFSLSHSLTTARRVAKPGKYWQGAPVTRRERVSQCPDTQGRGQWQKGRPPGGRERGRKRGDGWW